MPTPIDKIHIDLDQIQGNILAGFNKSHQRFLFLRIDDPGLAKVWLAGMIENVSTTTNVAKFNADFKAAIATDPTEATAPTASWLNIAFNHPGLTRLGAAGLNQFPDDFTQGMAARSQALGDVGDHQADVWEPWLQDRTGLHVLVQLAADLPADLDKSVADVTASLLGSGLSLMHIEVGEDPGNGEEHFGFKDGISQPGIKGFTLSSVPPPDENTGHQGVKGQDLLWPGEFVLGYPTQNRDRPEDFDGPNPAKGLLSANGPKWTRNGSYLVFRKLQQDVSGFRNSVRSNAVALGVDPEVLGAKIVGRYRSGCPLEALKSEPAGTNHDTGDPSTADPSRITDKDKINFFEYGADPKGINVPRASHIRKAYPRDEQTLLPDGVTPDEEQTDLHESNTQTHRILRRGIPFGIGMHMPATGLNSHFTDDQVSRGLLFWAYQSDITRQFEFIQKAWVNNQNFPEPGDGVDPVMSQPKVAPLQCPFKAKPLAAVALKHFVTTNGGEYFFAPSIAALTMLST